MITVTLLDCIWFSCAADVKFLPCLVEITEHRKAAQPQQLKNGRQPTARTAGTHPRGSQPHTTQLTTCLLSNRSVHSSPQLSPLPPSSRNPHHVCSRPECQSPSLPHSPSREPVSSRCRSPAAAAIANIVGFFTSILSCLVWRSCVALCGLLRRCPECFIGLCRG